MYRNIQTFAFKVLQECISWKSRNGVVQIFFLTAHKNMIAGKFVKSGFWLYFGSILFSMSNKLRFVKWVRFFQRNCIVKCVIFFARFCWFLDFLLGILKLKKSLMMSTGTSGQIQKHCMPKILSSKKEFQIWDFESFIFWSKACFLGSALWRFS